MTFFVHVLPGCAPSPLAHYLKGLAVLRLVREQRDAEARGSWKDEAFHLVTKLSREELISFFVDHYRPTPILSPWNAGSGFYFREGKTKEKDERGKQKKTGVRDAPTAATRAIDTLLATTSERLADYRECARTAKDALAALGLLEAPSDEQKAALIAALRARLPDAGIRWLDAAVYSAGNEFECAPLVGSGGNDGNEDFSKNFLERVLMIVGDELASAALLESSLFATPALGATMVTAGQFFPSGNGGANAGAGFEGRATTSAWDYVLAIEGSIVFAGAAARRLDGGRAGATFPFAVRVDPAGYPSASESDRDASRFEVWLPLWSSPASSDEIVCLLAEGRARIDRADAQRTTDVARAIASLGTSRGIAAFERTAFFTRNGNMHYSAPVGRFRATAQPNEELLADVDRWLRAFRNLARDENASKAISEANRAIDEAILDVCRDGSDALRWQRVLVALGRAEKALVRTPARAGDPKRGLTPLPPLRPGWIRAADDGTPELRLAVALASQDVALRQGGGEVLANVRAHWIPLDRSRASRRPHGERRSPRFAVDGTGRLLADPDVVCATDDLERDCIALVRRRAMLAASLRAPGLALFGLAGVDASLSDVTAFLDWRTDDARILSLARALMAVAWWSDDLLSPRAPRDEGFDAAYAIARITHLSKPLDRGEQVVVALDPEPIARLAAGDLAGAIAIALRRLRASGLIPTVRTAVGGASRARRIAAALAFPLRASDVRRCADLVTKPFEIEERHHG